MEETVEAALDRLAALTSIIRTRASDAARKKKHGGSVNEHHARMHENAVRLRKIADDLDAEVSN